MLFILFEDRSLISIGGILSDILSLSSKIKTSFNLLDQFTVYYNDFQILEFVEEDIDELMGL
jgi:hypothetical protein